MYYCIIIHIQRRQKSANVVHLNVVFCRSVAQNELNAADQEKMIGIAILSFISLVTLVFYFFVKNALSVIRVSGKVPGDTF